MGTGVGTVETAWPGVSGLSGHCRDGVEIVGTVSTRVSGLSGRCRACWDGVDTGVETVGTVSVSSGRCGDRCRGQPLIRPVHAMPLTTRGWLSRCVPQGSNPATPPDESSDTPIARADASCSASQSSQTHRESRDARGREPDWTANHARGSARGGARRLSASGKVGAGRYVKLLLLSGRRDVLEGQVQANLA